MYASLQTLSMLRRSQVRSSSRGDLHVMGHLGIPNAVRLDVYDSCFWYYDEASRTLHEWLCQCRACRTAWRMDAPSPRCRFKRKYVVHDSWADVGVEDLKRRGAPVWVRV